MAVHSVLDFFEAIITRYLRILHTLLLLEVTIQARECCREGEWSTATPIRVSSSVSH